MNLTITTTPTPTSTPTSSSSPTATAPTFVAPTTEASGEGDFEMAELSTTYARCSDGNGTMSHLFFSDDDHEIARAKAICVACGLKEDCLRGALEREEPYGVWGGKLVLDGVAVEFKRRRGRPRKNPLPVLVVDEVPLPPHLVA